MGGKTNYDPNSGRRLIENIRNEDWRNASIEMDQLQVNLSEPMRNIGCHLWWPHVSGYAGGAITLQPFDTILYDNGGFFNTSLFVPIIPPGCAGPYTITGYLRWDAAGPPSANNVLVIQKNGAALARTNASVVGFSAVTVTVGVYCEVGDRIDMAVYHAGANININAVAGNNLDPYSPAIRLQLNS